LREKETGRQGEKETGRQGEKETRRQGEKEKEISYYRNFLSPAFCNILPYFSPD